MTAAEAGGRRNWWGGRSSVGATLRSGADFIMSALELDKAAVEADVVITGEGSLDAQGLNGKVVIALPAADPLPAQAMRRTARRRRCRWGAQRRRSSAYRSPVVWRGVVAVPTRVVLGSRSGRRHHPDSRDRRGDVRCGGRRGVRGVPASPHHSPAGCGYNQHDLDSATDPRQLAMILGATSRLRCCTHSASGRVLAPSTLRRTSRPPWQSALAFVTLAALIPIPGGGVAVGAVGLSGVLAGLANPPEAAVAITLANQLAVTYLPAIPGWVATRHLLQHHYL